ncbi:hypothetical protein A3C67_03420 [Candidatus Nomurabacteria bacterium RIFCSPHIGHO2_02_FULL_42_19]|uniref:Phosphatidate cytidylyltransferase n=1 Tax=Candidatus Nomurabacteria bacterium RIFCSPHIGHO2_02_FULL_42_19 TaxID=1801756 RepID=A0A1F6W1V4_9BACT|nr:MAG: hypothetical protein A3C67_03420 [Candidatus Nomurabacteria bacterium RIFCSPHIGHO2_02_FULL_42_19]
MGHILFLIWYMIAILPFLIFIEGFQMFKDFMKKRNIEVTWLHYIVIILSILVIILWLGGDR